MFSAGWGPSCSRWVQRFRNSYVGLSSYNRPYDIFVSHVPLRLDFMAISLTSITIFVTNSDLFDKFAQNVGQKICALMSDSKT